MILVDYPGFNLRLANRLKKLKPSLNIIYVAPPQLWIWGNWRLKILKNCCSKIIVMYPFEVAWYAARGLTVEWHGLPLLERLKPHFTPTKKEHLLAVLPGSRRQEITTLLPIFVNSIKKLSMTFPTMRFALIQAASVEKTTIQAELDKQGIEPEKVIIVPPEQSLAILKTCFAALTKPGTCTLELALLQIPAVVAYQALAITYAIARCFTNIQYMALPNLFLAAPVYQERLQKECNAQTLHDDVAKIYKEFAYHQELYSERCNKLAPLKEQFLMK